MSKDFNLKEELTYLKENGWLTEKEVEQFSRDEEIIYCIDECISPNKKEKLIFNAFKDLNINDTSVVIVGQDPYPDTKKAHGMAFSFKDGSIPAVDSLKNIFLKLNLDIKSTQTDLTNWKRQGVLLLNTSLTYKNQNSIKIHTKKWKNFINTILQNLLDNKKQKHDLLVIILWGNQANKLTPLTLYREKKLSMYSNIKFLRSSHPSNNYQSCQKDIFKGNIKAFVKVDHFNECNEFLGKNNAIDWLNL